MLSNLRLHLNLEVGMKIVHLWRGKNDGIFSFSMQRKKYWVND